MEWESGRFGSVVKMEVEVSRGLLEEVLTLRESMG